MKYTLYYDDFEYVVEQNYIDVLDYEFTKTFNESYNQYYTLYTDKQKEFIKNFESNWMKNIIKESNYYTTHNLDFLTWLKDKYEEKAYQSQYTVETDMEPDDWWDDLDCSTKYDVMYTYTNI